MELRKREVRLERTLAKGGHSVVYIARSCSSFKRVAVKEIDLQADGGFQMYSSEVSVLKKLPRHVNLPMFLGKCLTKEKASIVMPYYPCPTLTKFIASNGPLEEKDALTVLRQLLEAVEVLAESGVAHRDIKPDNVLINPATLQIRLIDFGLGTTCDGKIDSESLDDRYVGTPLYMSPELILGAKHRVLPSELWSVGVLFWETLLGRNPFCSAENKSELLMKQKDDRNFSSFSEICQQILSGLLAFDAELRTPLKEILAQVRRVSAPPVPRKPLHIGHRSKSVDSISPRPRRRSNNS